MDSESVEPLRIAKSASTSPSKSPTMSRPLSEITPMGIRRNSPSVKQNTLSQKQSFTRDSSPFEPSPKANSPLSFWKNRESNSPGHTKTEKTANVPATPGQSRRVSVEALKKASRVNNNIFARNLDDGVAIAPASNRTLAGARPLSTQYSGIVGLRNGFGSVRGHAKADSESKVTFMAQDENRSPLSGGVRSISPSKQQMSPQKSSLSRASRYAAADDMPVLEEVVEKRTVQHVLRRPKSVTFDVAPPQINEYEHATPVPSSIASDSREGSYELDPYDMDNDYPEPNYDEREDSFEDSLEDTEKTPVVLPEDWRHMSPGAANTELADALEDPFNANHESPAQPSTLSRSNSVNRPLPPLPPPSDTAGEQVDRRLERSQSFQRTLPTPPRAPSISKQDIISMREASPMPLEERLRLLSVQRSTENLRTSSALAEQIQEESVLQDESESAESSHAADVAEEKSGAPQQDEFRAPSRISRESILRNIHSEVQDSDSVFDAENDEDPYDEYADLDPDVPIQSRETSGNFDDTQAPVLVEDEEEELYHGPGQDEDTDRAVSHAMRVAQELGIEAPHTVDFGRASSVIHHVELHPRSQLPVLDLPALQEESYNSTPVESRDVSKSTATTSASQSHSQDTQVSLPDFTSFIAGDDFGFGLRSYLSASPEDRPTPNMTIVEPAPKVDTPSTSAAYHLQPPPALTSQASFESMAESVIHHSITSDSESERSESPEVPEPVATIKATGMKLKTRVSSTPADIAAMAATRRLVSGELKLPVFDVEEEEEEEADEEEENFTQADLQDEMESDDASVDDIVHDRNTIDSDQPKIRKPSMKMKLELPIAGDSNDFSFGLDEEFERVMDNQKRGYVMRQNTKVVVASNRQISEDFRQAPTPATTTIPSVAAPATSSVASTKPLSARKPSEPWKAEPWNGKMRRQSTRRSNIVPERRISAVPPLPGQASNAEAVDAVDEALAYDNDDSGNPVERGRLFVKVVQVKDLELPIPRYGRCEFQMTLDNGMHCVTTSMLPLGKTSQIGQEFELVVFDDLEFQLTLQTQLPRPPKSPQSTVFSVTSSMKPSSKVSKLTRFLTSPKKRREMEQRQREEQENAARQQQSTADSKKATQHPGQWELQHELVGPDGSFARAYISLKDHEKQAFGRPYTVDVPCFNEWAVEDKTIASSTRSKLGGIQRRPPYKIGKMELHMMYIPRPRGTKEDDMPRSMSAALRQLKEAENMTEVRFEGHLSQQGGDCPFWRRRYFRLEGSKLTAFHETTRQPRVSISLAKAVKLIDDRPALLQPDPASNPSKNRRKSAFTDENEEGYMFVEEGFRIRFANGEVIDFYADKPKDKEDWMRALSQVVGKELVGEKISWSSAVIARERALLARNGGKANHLDEGKLPVRGPSKTVLLSPMKKTTSTSTSPTKKQEAQVETIEEEPAGYQPSPAMSTAAEKQNATKRFSAQAPPKEKDTSTRGKRQAVKSMIF